MVHITRPSNRTIAEVRVQCDRCAKQQRHIFATATGRTPDEARGRLRSRGWRLERPDLCPSCMAELELHA